MTAQGFDAVIVGAGFAGMGAAIQLQRLGFDNLAIIDREDDLGGTWHVNRYPRLTVDIPSTTYSYWFEPNPYWTRLHAPGAELKRYADHVAEKYDLRRHMRFGTSVESAQWDEDSQRWQVSLGGGDTLTARFLITATGYLSQPRIPDIPGIAGFGGRIMHSAQWDHDHRLDGQRVGIIGTGVTAVQLIPELAARASELTVYQRTPIWVVPRVDFPIPTAIRRLFARFPVAQRLLRLLTDAIAEAGIFTTVVHYNWSKPLNRGAAQVSKLHLRTSVPDRATRRKLTPDYDFGCKRTTFSNHYYRTFGQPNVRLETTGITHIEPDGIVTGEGRRIATDTLVLATGFDLWDANFPAIEVVGRAGTNLGKWWRENSFRTYQGVSVPGFPNYLNLASPYAFTGASFFTMTEYQMRHMSRLFGELAHRGCDTFEVTEEASTDFHRRISRRLGDMVFFRGNCATSRSYYFRDDATITRPTSRRNAIRESMSFPLSDYHFS